MSPSVLIFAQDVGQSILESYSRILESLAFAVMSQIEDVLRADSLTQDPSHAKSGRRQSLTDSEVGPVKKLDPKEEMEKLKEAPNSMTLSDFMGWHFDPDSEAEKKNSESLEDGAKIKKPPNIVTTKKFSYIEKLENLRSPTARH